jgi:hypothetical protein
MTCVMVSAATLFPRAFEPLAEHLEGPAPAGRSGQLLRMDRLCGLALCVADRALLAPAAVGCFDPDATAVLVGSRHGCHKSDEDFYRGLLAGQPSPRLFAYTLPSSPVGEISIQHGLLGAGLSIVSGRTAGLESVAQAESLLRSGQAQACLVIGCEVAAPALLEYPSDTGVCDGAAAILVRRGTGDGCRGSIVTSTTMFVDGDPGAALVACIAELLEAAPRGQKPFLCCDPETRCFIPRTLGAVREHETPACGAAAPLAVLAGLADRSDGDDFLVLSADPAGLAAAVWWRRGAGAGR